MKDLHVAILRKTVPILKASGAVVVGGAVRDRLLKRPVLDVDLALEGDPLRLAPRIASAVGGTSFVLDETRRIVRVTAGGLQLDFTTFQGDTLESDIDRRDFTVNALAVPVERWVTAGWNRSVIDRHRGAADLKKKTIAAVSKGIFKDDPLRLLRAFRLSSELDFSIAPATLARIRAERSAIRRSAPERIREELLKIFSTPRAYETLCRMEDAGILETLLPEVRSLRKTAPRYYGKGGVLKHTLDSVRHFERVQETLGSWFPGSGKKVADYLKVPIAGYPRYAHLKWALLLHDFGKPKTAKMIGGRLRFFEHEHAGADMVPDLMPRFRWSTEETQSYARLVRNHMRPGNLATHENVSDKALHRFFRDLGEDAVAMILVSLADHLTYLSPAQLRKRNSAHETLSILMIRRYYHQREKLLPRRLLTGFDVMEAFNVPPSPAIGQMLEDVKDAQVERGLRTKAEALAFLKGRLSLYEKKAS